jgi:hypothetical protein
MKMNANLLRTYLPQHDLMAFAGAPAVYHCHHFNLFLDQTIDDALGPEGATLRFVAARESARSFLESLCGTTRALTPVERLECAAEAFAAMGHGRLHFTADASGGEVVGEFLHYGYTWSQKYGHKVRRRSPADAFAAGFAAAAVEHAFNLPRESMQAEEVECLATRAPRCRFVLKPGPARVTDHPPVREADVAAHVRPPFDGLDDARVAHIAAGLRDFTAGVRGDQNGVVSAFGVFVTMHLAGYYNRISYDALRRLEAHAPQSVPVFEDLLAESGHVCVFNTFGGILQSPEWEGLVGPLTTTTPRDLVTGCLAIGRALGFGRWALTEFEPGRRLVVRAPGTYESAWYLTHEGTAVRPNEYFFRGAVLAIARLAQLDWRTPIQLTPEFYQQLFRGASWKATQSQSTAMGAPYSEVVVTHE